ncbi:hypothetical protein Tco_1285651 [Tanacetum coccineum]
MISCLLLKKDHCVAFNRTEDGVTRLTEYVELNIPAKAIQSRFDIKSNKHHSSQGLHLKSMLFSQTSCSKRSWEKIKLLMQGTSLTKQERECKLYDEFDKFTYKKGETLHEYYLRFTLLLNDMNIYKIAIGSITSQRQVLKTLFLGGWKKWEQIEEIAFLADPRLPDIHTSQTVITHNAAYQADDLGMPMTLTVMNSTQQENCQAP